MRKATKCTTNSNDNEYQVLPSAVSIGVALPKAVGDPQDVERAEEKQVGAINYTTLGASAEIKLSITYPRECLG